MEPSLPSIAVPISQSLILDPRPNCSPTIELLLQKVSVSLSYWVPPAGCFDISPAFQKFQVASIFFSYISEILDLKWI